MILKPIHAHDREFRLLHDEETVVGRKECRALIDGDPSISRVHAKLLTQLDGTVFITDLSKYGTSVNKNKLNKEQRHRLKEGDLIKFGNQPNKSEFRLLKTQWIFCCSNMNASQKVEVKKSAAKLGGVIVDSWNSSCTHLIMDNIVVTVKVVNTLSSLKPIVTPKWLEDSVTAIRNGNSIPDHADYLPEVMDPNCNESKASFLPDERRSYLLSGKVFYFLTEKQYNRLHDCINNGGGICRLATSQESLTDLNELTDSNAVVMSIDSNTLSSLDHNRKEWIQQVLSFVKSKGYRPIVDSEVGFALLRISIERDCNPLSHQMLDSLPPATLSQQRDVPPPSSSGNSLGNVTVYADDTLFGSEPSGGVLNSTPSMPKGKNTSIAHKPPVKKEVEEEGEEVSVSLSMQPDAAISSSGVNQLTSKYFEPQLQANPVSTAVSSMPEEIEEKAVPPLSSPDGLSCSPSTFHSSLPTASTSVMVPGTFTQKNSKEKDTKTLSNFFSTRKRKRQTEVDTVDLTDDNVIDLTITDEVPSPVTSTSTTNTTSIYDVLAAKRRKRNTESRSKAGGSHSVNGRKGRADTTDELLHKKDNSDFRVVSSGCDKEATDSEVVQSLGESGSNGNHGRSADVENDAPSSINGGLLQEHGPMEESQETSNSQRPILKRFQYLTQKKSNGFISARSRNRTVNQLNNEPSSDGSDDLSVAPTVLCEQVSLVVHHVTAMTEAAAVDTLTAAAAAAAASEVVNFKRFKKARYIGMGGLPTIIGSTELAYFNGETTNLTQEWHREHEELESSVREEAPDPFEMPNRRR